MTTERSNGLPGASLLIDTLLPGAEPTVLADHGAPRAWAPLPRIGGTRAPPTAFGPSSPRSMTPRGR